VLFVITMIVFLVIQTVNLTNGIISVQDQTPVVTTSHFRQNALIYTNYLVRIWNGALKGDFSTGDWITDSQSWRYYMGPSTDLLRGYNQELWELVTGMPMEIQDRFYEKNIPIYERQTSSLDSKKLISMDSSFEAVQRIVDRETRIVNMDIPFVFSTDIDTSNFDFVLDNSVNDVLIASENLVAFLINELDSSIDSTRTSMGITLTGVLAAAVIFLCITLRYMYVINRDAEKFMTLVFRISTQEGEAAQDILQRFNDALEMNMKTFKLPQEQKNNIAKDADGGSAQNNTVKYRKASMTGFYRSKRLKFLQLIPNFVSFICWSIVYYFLTSEFMEKIQVSETQMQTALRGLYHQNVITYEFSSLSLTNGSSFFRNENFLPDFIKNLNDVQDTQGFVKNFRESNGSLTPLKESLLFDFPCHRFNDFKYKELQYVYPSCVALESQNAKIGLLSITSSIYNLGKQYLDAFENSPKTRFDLAMLFLTGVSGFQNLVVVAQGLLNILYESTHESFEASVSRIKEQTLTFTLSMAVVVMMITVITWFLVLKKIFKSQNIDQKILQIIPVKFILDNKHLQRYVLRFSDGQSLDGLKRFY